MSDNSMSYFIVNPGPDCPYPIDNEGVYTDIDVAMHVAAMCGGTVSNVYVDEHIDFLKEGKWVYNSCIKLSEPEIVFCKPSKSLLDAGESLVGHTQYSPDRDRLYAYVWAKNEEEAKSIMWQLRLNYRGRNNA
jgi:hypothetical protein